MKATVATLLLLALVGSVVAIELSHEDVTLLDLEPVSLGELMAQASVSDAPSVRDLAFKLRNNVLAHRELTKAAHEHYSKSSCGNPLARLENHVARGVQRRRNSLRYAAVARRRCYQRNNNARELFPKIQNWKRYRRKAIKNLQRAAKRFFKEDGRLKRQVKQLKTGLETVKALQTTLYGADSLIQVSDKTEFVSLLETSMTATDTLSQQVYTTVRNAVAAGAPVDAVFRLVSGVRSRLKTHRAAVRAQRERARSSWISLKASLQARVDSLNVRISRARARQASIASFSGRNCRLAARAAYKASKASKALNPARIALENLKMLCTRENAAFNSTMRDTKWELEQLLSVADKLGVPNAEVGAWYASPRWSKCLGGTQSRKVTCRNLGGVQIGVAACSTAAPADKRTCTKKPSARYRKWLLKHGREFGALSGKGSSRHKGYRSRRYGADSRRTVSESEKRERRVKGDHRKLDEDIVDSITHSESERRRGRGRGRGRRGSRRSGDGSRVSAGSLRRLRAAAAKRAADRARARAARAARRAMRNKKRIARRKRARANKAKKEKKKRAAKKARKAKKAKATPAQAAATPAATPAAAAPAPAAGAEAAPAPAAF